MHFELLKRLVHYVFNPALVEGNLADTITFENFVTLEHSHYIYNRVNFGMDPSQNHKGSQKPRRKLRNLPIIIIPAICKDKGSPFGDPDVYYTYGMIGSVYIWSYVYNIMRVSGSLATRVIKYYNKLNQKMPLIYVKLYTYQLDTLTSDISNMNDVLLAKPAGLKKRYVGSRHTSEWFNTAGRSVKTRLIASVIISQWTWTATILQSSNVAWEYGVSNPF
ncbi:protein PIN-LIKES 3-like [Arachis ipaensis]|uniref:protein PIN-LIKES 3-like n=1 Tax=Arachis ipaensis TaxID=130454 RepID=UPI0007AFCE2C|nr:protein PIN-LIKES 3-like [Arachis ipaensis]